MSSQIESIYNAIATWTPTYSSDVTITVRDADELKDKRLENGPVRMLFLPEDAPGAFIAIGKSFRNTWLVNDRLYYKKTGGGNATADANGKMRDYIVSYLDSIKANRAPTAQSHISEWTFSVRTDLMYGADDESWYGVDVLLTIEEFVT